jgi:hypothetical protein
MSEHSSSSGGSGSAQATVPAVQQAIDVTKLAEKVYQLMQADARLARARGQARGPRR